MHEGKVKERTGMSVLASLGSILALQEASDSAPVPMGTAGWWWLGAARWWVPWQMQRAVAAVWALTGGRADGLLECYTPEKEWERLVGKKQR
jgi:hypothetical protein